MSEQGGNEEVSVAEDSNGNVDRTKMKISIKGEEQKDPSDATSVLVSNSVLLSYYNSRPEELSKIGKSGVQRNANLRSSQPAASSPTV